MRDSLSESVKIYHIPLWYLERDKKDKILFRSVKMLNLIGIERKIVQIL